MAPIRRWNPTFTMLLALEEDAGYHGNLPGHVITGPRTNGLPEPVPYPLRGLTEDVPYPPPPRGRRGRPARRAYAPPVSAEQDWPTSAPCEWIADWNWKGDA